VVQDHVSGEIRMLAYATREAVERTLSSGRATFFSRSRGELWEKGATSGNGLDVVSVLVDCDADALVYQVRPRGPTCHTGAPSCFFRVLGADGEANETSEAAPVPAATVLGRLDAVLLARRSAGAAAASSYTKTLYDGGPPRIGAKLREEADELARAVAEEADERVVAEAADVIFHVMVALRSRNVGIDSVLRELERRSGVSGHDEKKARKPDPAV
jgi:phosphoribosyl-ATP pyrophosphohydrolase/phosphoribosyl-AMP cyclohydrolase